MSSKQMIHRKVRHTGNLCALFWDESLLWGLMAWRALIEAGLPFDLLRSEDIRAGTLSRYAMIFVPGGWASAKLRTLGEKGQAEIRSFVENGGSYLGICGGAGLATESGIGLMPIQRKATQERIPSFSGPVRLSLVDHVVWENVESSVFSAWWPSQFQVLHPDDVHILARYDEAEADAFSADIKVVDGRAAGWPKLEERYGIYLDPERLRGEPAVLAGRFGKGQVILSLIHFDTPWDFNGRVVLGNLWNCLIPASCREKVVSPLSSVTMCTEGVTPELAEIMADIQASVSALITAGMNHSLWYWRNPLLLQWRRGVRGLEYSTLAVMVGEIAACFKRGKTEAGTSDSSNILKDLRVIREGLIPFCEKAEHLLVREKDYMMTSPLSPLDCPDEEITSLRQGLFGPVMSHGGQFKCLIDTVDRLLYRLLKDS
jgi:putative intracellular protease/amidase